MINGRELFAEISNEAISEGGEIVGYFVKNSRMDFLECLLSAPPAPAVPEEMKRDPDADVFDPGFMNGWNACRAAMLNHVGDTNEKSKSSIAKTRQEIANDFEIGARATKHRFSLDGKSAAPEGGNDHNTR